MGKEYADMRKGEIFPLPLCPSHFFLEAGSSSLRDLEDGIEMVYAGAVSPNRKVHILLDIVKEVKKKTQGKVHLTIFGKIDKVKYKAFLRKRISDMGLENEVEILPQVPREEVPQLIKRANIGVCILPPNHAYRVSSPTKVVEYLSVGIPVVANREIEDQRLLIESSGGGFSPPYDVEKISNAIIEMASDPKKAKRMGLAGRNWVLKNRSYRELAFRLDRRYRKLIEDL
jgi:glycosyltransferase involved in cell wall biosynthesis